MQETTLSVEYDRRDTLNHWVDDWSNKTTAKQAKQSVFGSSPLFLFG